MPLSIIILAAGRGTRMCSELPKVMHPLAGLPILEHVIQTALSLKPTAIYTVVGAQAARLREHFKSEAIQWVEQKQQLGTAHAVLQALPHIPDSHQVLILYGDVPLIRAATLRQLLNQTEAHPLAILVAKVDNPAGLGRIIRDQDGRIVNIVEERDTSEAQKQIHEINTGIMASHANTLKFYLPKISDQNHQHEFYLTDVVPLSCADNLTIGEITTNQLSEIKGINTRAQLAELEREFMQNQAQQLLAQGVQIIDPARFDCRGKLISESDTRIDIDVILEGEVTLGSGSYIGPFCQIKNCKIGKNVTIKGHCVMENVEIKDGCTIGPFAHLRPGTVLNENARIGNFVEVKKSTFGRGSKANHLAYIGDATIGDNVNIGAGTITCNYDGVNKHQTIIENGAFIGSNTSLIAPVTIGKNATVGAGSAIAKDAPADQLTLERSKQTTVPGWQRPANKEEA